MIWQSFENPSPVQRKEPKSFYYDCLDEECGPSESEKDFKIRLEKQNEVLANIRKVHGCHIRLGTLKGTRKTKRQKEVDIMLAVDMMVHAAQKNMDKAVLFAGDQDFKPVVESLVQLGVFVQIIGDAKHTSRELTWAASAYQELTFHDFCFWTSEDWQSQYPLPESFNYQSTLTNMSLFKEGSVNGDRCSLYQSPHGFLIKFLTSQRQERALRHDDPDRLQQYLELTYGPVVWDEAS